jgi:hypothetical protein
MEETTQVVRLIIHLPTTMPLTNHHRDFYYRLKMVDIDGNFKYSEAFGANGYMLQGDITSFSSFYFASTNSFTLFTLPLDLLFIHRSFTKR